jgi:hypothetical protein
MSNLDLLDDSSPSDELPPSCQISDQITTPARNSPKDSWPGVAIIVASLTISIAWFSMLGWGALRILRWLFGL